MGKSLVKPAAVFVAVFVAGLLYMEWGSFEYNVPDGPRPAMINHDGSPNR